MLQHEGEFLGDVEFMLYTYKVERCMISHPHAWKNCPYVHHQEPIKRRHPTQHTSQLCPVVKKGQVCSDEKCCFAHNAFELWLHPEKYKTMMCRKRAACSRGICFFAHSEAELRAPCKARSINLSQNPAAAAGAIEAAMRFKAVAQALPIATAPMSATDRQSPSMECHARSTYTSGPAGCLAMPPGASSTLPYPLLSNVAPVAQNSASFVAATHMLAPEATGVLRMRSAAGLADGFDYFLHLQPPDCEDSAPVCQDCLPDGVNDEKLQWPADYSVRAPSGRSSNISSSSRLDAADVMMSDLYTPGVIAHDYKHTCDGVPRVSATAIANLHPPCGIPSYGQGSGALAARSLFSTGCSQLQRPMLLGLEAAAAAVKAQMALEPASSVPAHEAALQAAADRVAAVLFSGRYSGLSGSVGGTVDSQVNNRCIVSIVACFDIKRLR